MENNIHVIVARQMEEAQAEHATALRIVERIQLTLNKRSVRLAEAGKRLIDIEEIHNNLSE